MEVSQWVGHRRRGTPEDQDSRTLGRGWLVEEFRSTRQRPKAPRQGQDLAPDNGDRLIVAARWEAAIGGICWLDE